MLKIALCDDNLDSIQLVKKFLESQIIEQNVNAEISIVTDNQEKIEELIKNKKIDILISRCGI